jgi:hypothetical protein
MTLAASMSDELTPSESTFVSMISEASIEIPY